MTAPRRWLLVAVLATGVLGAVASTGRGAAGPAATGRPGSLPVTTASLVCPAISGTPDAVTTVTVASVRSLLPGRGDDKLSTTVTPLAGGRLHARPLALRTATRIRYSSTPDPVLLSMTGPGADTVAADQRRLVPSGRGRGLVSSRCLTPATDWWVTGADGRIGFTDLLYDDHIGKLLFLANPGRTAANLTVTAWSAGGRLQPPKLRSFTVPASEALLLPVADYAPDAAFVTLHVHANSGRVAASVVDRRVHGVRPAGVDWIPPTRPPAAELVIPGFPGGGGSRWLIVTNPGAVDATVSLRLSTLHGSFAPAGHPTVLVRAEHSIAVNLTESFGAVAGAVVLSSDGPVTAAGISTSRLAGRPFPDIQWQPAGELLDGPAVIPEGTPPFDSASRLYLTAPGRHAQVRVAAADGKSETVEVRAGRTTVFDPELAFGSAGFGPMLLTPVGAAPVYGSRMLYAAGAHGPLLTSEQPTVLPRAVSLPAVHADMRTALP